MLKLTLDTIEGYGYIAKIFGVGIAVFYNIKYTLAYNGRRVHKHVILGNLTPYLPYNTLYL